MTKRPSPPPDPIHESSVQEYFRVVLNRALSTEERQLLGKALLAYAGMTPLEPSNKTQADALCKKLGL